LVTAVPAMLATHIPNAAPRTPEMSTVTSCSSRACGRKYHNRHATSDAGDAADGNSAFRTVNDVCFLQKVRFRQVAERGIPSGRAVAAQFACAEDNLPGGRRHDGRERCCCEG
jgi:hypothetical protein